MTWSQNLTGRYLKPLVQHPQYQMVIHLHSGFPNKKSHLFAVKQFTDFPVLRSHHDGSSTSFSGPMMGHSVSGDTFCLTVHSVEINRLFSRR